MISDYVCDFAAFDQGLKSII